MNRLLPKCANLYAKSLIVAIPTGIIVTNYEQIVPIEYHNYLYQQTCAEKIVNNSIDVILPTFYNTFMGLSFSLMYPIVTPLYLAHKLEQYNPSLFKTCHQNDIIETPKRSVQWTYF